MTTRRNVNSGQRRNEKKRTREIIRSVDLITTSYNIMVTQLSPILIHVLYTMAVATGTMKHFTST